MADTPDPLAPGWLTLEQVLDIVAIQDNPRLALALSGGGATGAHQAGALQAFAEALARRPPEIRQKLTPTLIVGTSAGSLNAFGLFIEALGLTHSVLRQPGRSYPASLWEAVGERHDGARFIVGKRAWLIALVTRWLKNRRLRWAVVSGLGLLLFAVNPVLFAWWAADRETPWLRSLGQSILGAPLAFSLLGMAVFVLIAFVLLKTFRRAAFASGALRNLLAALVDEPPGSPGYREHVTRDAGKRDAAAIREHLLRPRSPTEEHIASRRLIEAAQALSAPELVIAATDLTVFRDALFTVVKPVTYDRLARAGWLTLQVGKVSSAPEMAPCDTAGRVSDTALIDCVVASSSIPGAFPSVRIPVHSLADDSECAHDFIDGGILNNAPIHIAIDCGATHILSLELKTLVPPHPILTAAGERQPHLAATLDATVRTLYRMATAEDVRRMARTNREVAAGEADARLRTVPVFRLGPVDRSVGLIEFNGHYMSALSPPNPSLGEWLAAGYRDAAEGCSFWNASLVAEPDAPRVNGPRAPAPD